SSVYIGGPVEPQRGFVLHDCDSLPEKTEILPGLYMSVTLEALKPLLESADVRVRLCLGYSGWGPQQLERELTVGSWLFTEAAVDTVLDSEPDQLWDETLRGMGVNPLALVPGGGLN
ncbi:MAG TPA: YqgE/AlgH family protein, partial [Myxococcaceae bacterium]|nr:YqgE/AlgH family protein [Myxococcaceae bacterium]